MGRVLLGLLLASLALPGCAAVRPWEREALARPGMRLTPGPDATAEQHMFESREASIGGYGAEGGGCGCN